MVTHLLSQEKFSTMDTWSKEETSLHSSLITNNTDFPLSVLDASFDVLDSVLSSRSIFVSLVIDANRKGKNTWSLLKLVSTSDLFTLTPSLFLSL